MLQRTAGYSETIQTGANGLRHTRTGDIIRRQLAKSVLSELLKDKKTWGERMTGRDIINELAEYCNSLDEDCPVLLLDVLTTLQFYKEHEHEVCANCQYEKMNDFDFVGWLIKIMDENKWNETQLAEHFGTSRQAISHYITGKRFPMLYTFIQMLEAENKRIEIVNKG